MVVRQTRQSKLDADAKGQGELEAREEGGRRKRRGRRRRIFRAKRFNEEVGRRWTHAHTHIHTHAHTHT